MKNLVIKIAVSSLLLVIIGCGGGDGGDFGGSGQSEQITQVTSLIENPLASPKESSSYIEHNLSIYAKDDSLDKNLLSKVYTENNETLYLGNMYAQPFHLNVTLPASEKNVLYQLFTANIADNIYFGELEL